MSTCSPTGGGPSVCGYRPPTTTWDLTDELDAFERRDRRKAGISEKASMLMKGRKESRKEKAERLKAEEELFDTDAFPTSLEMFEASLFEVIDGAGKSWAFGDLIKDQKTIVVFIRHWYCPLCQDYVHSIVQDVDPEAVKRAGAKLIIIGNGAPAVIDSYQGKAFQCPFPIYTDPSLELYRAMGMTRQTGDGGTEDEKGEYIKHSALGGGLFVAQNIGKMGRKGITLQPGHFTQLGGEFVCGPGRNISYVHRMSTTRGHNPIKVALGYAGVLNPDARRNRRGNFALGLEVEAGIDTSTNAKRMSGYAGSGPGAWRAQRDGELDRMRAWREERRRGKLFREVQEAQNEPIPETNGGDDDDDEDGDGGSTPGGRRRTITANNGMTGIATPMANLSVSPVVRSADRYEASEPTTPRSLASSLHAPLEQDHDAPRSVSPLPTFAFPQPPAHLPNFLPSPSSAQSSASEEKSMFRFPTPEPASISRASSPAGPNLVDPIALSINFSKGSTPKLLGHSRGNSSSSNVAWGKRAGSPAQSAGGRGASPHSSTHSSHHSASSSVHSTSSADKAFAAGDNADAIQLIHTNFVDHYRGRTVSPSKWTSPADAARDAIDLSQE